MRPTQGRINATKALHKDAKMRPFCKDAKFASKDAKTRLWRPGGLEPPYIYLLRRWRYRDKINNINDCEAYFYTSNYWVVIKQLQSQLINGIVSIYETMN